MIAFFELKNKSLFLTQTLFFKQSYRFCNKQYPNDTEFMVKWKITEILYNQA